MLPRFSPMISPVHMIAIHGRAQSSPVEWKGQTGPIHRMAALDRMGLFWTNPFMHIILTLHFSQVLPTTWLILTLYYRSPPNTDSDWYYTTFVWIFCSIKIYFPIKRLTTRKVHTNPGHHEGSAQTKPSPVCQHPGLVRSQSRNLLE